MIELVVFDLAGTTVYDGDAVAACFRAALAAVGVTPTPAAVQEVMGLPKPAAIRQLLTAAGRTPSDAEVDAIHADFVARMKSFYLTDASVREIPGARTTFGALRQAGIKVACNTGFSRDIVSVLLERLGWSVPGVLDAVICSDEAPRGRPYPDMIQTLMQRLGITDPKRVAKVGDTWADLEEGASAGCGLNIGVTTGSFTREQLETKPHTHVLESVADLPGLLVSLAGSSIQSGGKK